MYGCINWSLAQAHHQFSLVLFWSLSTQLGLELSQRLGSGLMSKMSVLESNCAFLVKKPHLDIKSH